MRKYENTSIHMNEQEATNDGTSATPVATAAPVETSFKCPTCSREFASERALQTHQIRSHKQFWSTNKGQRRSSPRAKMGRPPKNKAAVLAKHKEYYKRYAAKLKAQGLTTHGNVPVGRGSGRKKNPHLGKTCPVCSRSFATRAIMGHHLRAIHGKSLTQFNNGPEPRSLVVQNLSCPVCSKTYGRRAYLAIHTRKVHGKSIAVLEKGSTSEPTPEAVPAASARKLTQQQTASRPVIYCPVCGTNIHNVQTAVNFGEIQ